MEWRHAQATLGRAPQQLHAVLAEAQTPNSPNLSLVLGGALIFRGRCSGNTCFDFWCGLGAWQLPCASMRLKQHAGCGCGPSSPAGAFVDIGTITDILPRDIVGVFSLPTFSRAKL